MDAFFVFLYFFLLKRNLIYDAPTIFSSFIIKHICCVLAVINVNWVGIFFMVMERIALVAIFLSLIVLRRRGIELFYV